MKLEKQTQSIVGESSEHPKLPEWTPAIESPLVDRGCRFQQFGFTAGRFDGCLLDVVLDRELVVVDPYWWSAKGAGPVEAVAEFRHMIDSGIEMISDLVHRQLAGSVQKRPRINNGQASEVARPLIAFEPQEHQVGWAQSRVLAGCSRSRSRRLRLGVHEVSSGCNVSCTVERALSSISTACCANSLVNISGGASRMVAPNGLTSRPILCAIPAT